MNCKVIPVSVENGQIVSPINYKINDPCCHAAIKKIYEYTIDPKRIIYFVPNFNLDIDDKGELIHLYSLDIVLTIDVEFYIKREMGKKNKKGILLDYFALLSESFTEVSKTVKKTTLNKNCINTYLNSVFISGDFIHYTRSHDGHTTLNFLEINDKKAHENPYIHPIVPKQKRQTPTWYFKYTKAKIVLVPAGYRTITLLYDNQNVR